MRNRVPQNLKSLLIIIYICLAPFLSSSAKIIATLDAGFDPENPAEDWSFFWNPTGVDIGNSAQYSPLFSAGRMIRVDPELKQNSPDLGDGQFLGIKVTGWAAGSPAYKSSDGKTHYAMIAYTVQTGEAGTGILKGSAERVNNTGSGEILVFVNDEQRGTQELNTGEDQWDFEIPLNNLQEGDVVYLAFGRVSSTLKIILQFTIETEPATEPEKPEEPEAPITLG